MHFKNGGLIKPHWSKMISDILPSGLYACNCLSLLSDTYLAHSYIQLAKMWLQIVYSEHNYNKRDA